MKTMTLRRFSALLLLALLIAALAVPALAASEAPDTADAAAVQATDDSATGNKALAAGIAVGLAAGAGAIGMGVAVGKSVEGISRQPEAESKIRTSMMLGLVFVETAIIYALIIAILIIFVL